MLPTCHLFCFFPPLLAFLDLVILYHFTSPRSFLLVSLFCVFSLKIKICILRLPRSTATLLNTCITFLDTHVLSFKNAFYSKGCLLKPGTVKLGRSQDRSCSSRGARWGAEQGWLLGSLESQRKGPWGRSGG